MTPYREKAERDDYADIEIKKGWTMPEIPTWVSCLLVMMVAMTAIGVLHDVWSTTQHQGAAVGGGLAFALLGVAAFIRIISKYCT